MPKPLRRANDSQIERLLTTLKDDPAYRKDLARRIAERDNIKYSSAMRRLQRYVTEGEQKRSIYHAPVQYRREIRQEFRREPPRIPLTEREYTEPRERITRPSGERDEPFFDEGEDEDEGGGGYGGGGGFEDFEESPSESREITANDVRAILAYHDGDVHEAAERLNLSPRAEGTLDLIATSEGVDINRLTAGPELIERAREFYNDLEPDQVAELEAFHDALMDMTDWQIAVIYEDLRNGFTSWEDWLDLLDFDRDFWELFREAYERAA